MTDNMIGAEGAKAMSEMVKVNKTLTSLTLNSEEEKTVKEKKEDWMTDNGIGAEGAKALSEMLKVNSTLTSLNLICEEEREKEKRKKKNE